MLDRLGQASRNDFSMLDWLTGLRTRIERKGAFARVANLAYRACPWAEGKPSRCARQAAWILLAIAASFAVLALIDAGLPREERCAYQVPKILTCVVAKHETLVASLIGLAAALFAAMKAWVAIMRQIEADRKNTRDAERAYVTGGPGHRWVDQDGNHIGIVFTAMNTGRTPAFTTMVYWGICKESDWARVEKDWPRVKEANCEPWDEVLPPGMQPGDRYIIPFTATPQLPPCRTTEITSATGLFFTEPCLETISKLPGSIG
jgi:hypothetical protein